MSRVLEKISILPDGVGREFFSGSILNSSNKMVCFFGDNTFWNPFFQNLSKSGNESFYVEDGIIEFKNNNLSILTSLIFNINDFDKSRQQDLLKMAEKESSNPKINDQSKYLVDQKIEVLRSLN